MSWKRKFAFLVPIWLTFVVCLFIPSANGAAVSGYALVTGVAAFWGLVFFAMADGTDPGRGWTLFALFVAYEVGTLVALYRDWDPFAVIAMAILLFILGFRFAKWRHWQSIETYFGPPRRPS